MLVEVDALVEFFGEAVEVGEEVELLVARFLDPREGVDDRLRMDFLLDIDWHNRNS
ncbi:MAG TPA: hypothetical protein VGK58_25010 [Lacipirellulaceae bacterium]